MKKTILSLVSVLLAGSLHSQKYYIAKTTMLQFPTKEASMPLPSNYNLHAGDTVYVTGLEVKENGSVRLKTKSGYFVDPYFLEGFDLNDSTVQKAIVAEKKRQERIKANAQQERMAELKKKYGSRAKDVMNGVIWIGASRDAVWDSWGQPDKINKTIGRYGTHEQWVYGDQYIYLDNGKVTTIQTSN
jgi:hypothetical protein